MTNTIDLADFVLARNAEDEAAINDLATAAPELAFGVRKARAECAAKQGIVSMHPEAVRSDMRTGAAWAYGEALRWLALPYADHPDYREEWRP